MLARIDFHKGSLTGEGGFDSTSGSGVAITEADPGVGVYAADWTSDASNFGIVAIDAVDENWVYAYIILDAAPASDLTVLQLLASSTVIGELVINSSRQLELKQDGTQIGSVSSALTLGTLYRIGLRQKVGTGANAELQGYLGERHAALTSFASAANRTFTAQADELRVGAIDAVALDARIGYVAASERGWPASWLDLHDIVVGPMGFMGKDGPSSYSVSDMVPAYDRAALGERRHDTFQAMSFVAQANFSGGVGQSRLVSSDRILTGIADTRFSGYAFPPRATHAEANGSLDELFYFNRGNTLYAISDTSIQVVPGTSTSATNGEPVQQPVVDGYDDVYWVNSSNQIRKWTGSGGATDITPVGYSALHVALYERFLWAFGNATYPSAGVVQSNSDTFRDSGTTRTLSFASPAFEAEWTACIAVVYVNDATDPDFSLSDTSVADGWIELPGAAGTIADMQQRAYVHTGGDIGSISVELVTSGADTDMHIVEFEGIDAADVNNAFVGLNSFTEAPGSTTASEAMVGGARDGQVLFSAIGQDATGSISPGSGWTELADPNVSPISTQSQWRLSPHGLASWSSLTSGASKVGCYVVMRAHPQAGQTVFEIRATKDRGSDWIIIPANFSMNVFGAIRSHVATAGALWLATDRGLFRMVGEVNETLDESQIAAVAITKHDTWERPLDGNSGTFIGSFQGLLYYVVGATIRRYAPNSSDPNDNRAFWPDDSWATVAAKVQALTANEGGIWWGSGGYLWCFNGVGVHQMQAEPAAGAFDTLFWHNGRLYYNTGDTNPSSYFNYGYVNIRPDILIDTAVLDQDDFTTGYVITSSLDFEKVADPKIIRLRESQVSFTDQNTTSGEIAFHYRNGCGTDADPGVGSGGDTGSTWTAWGTHAFSDGGYERSVLPTPLQCYRLFVRATLTPGNTGIPVLHFFTIWGQSVMPPVQRMVAQITASVGQVNRENGLMWGDADEVKQALRVLKGWRNRKTPEETLYHTVTVNDGTDGGNEFVTTFTALEYTLSEQSNDNNRVSFDAAMAFEELPS